MDWPPIVSLELGTSSVRALIAEIRDDDHLMIVGHGECPARGIRKGEIVDFDTALSCVRIALSNAEENGNVVINEVYVLVSGGHIQSSINRGSIPIMSDDREIIRDDINHVIETARAMNLPHDREILHSICRHFYVDDQKGVINPEGMEGSKLALDMLIIHGLRNRLRNLVRIARSVPVEVTDVAFAGLCAALAVATPEEKSSGCLVLDLGGGTTDYVAYAGGIIAEAGSLAVGGDHVTNDIARGLRISNQHAEELKLKSGSAVVNMSKRTQKLDLPEQSLPAGKFVTLGDLHTIMNLRMEETLNLVRARCEKDGLIHSFGSGVVLTGGCARMPGLDRLAEKVFGLPCRIGTPRDISGFASTVGECAFAAPVGMLRFAARGLRREQQDSGISSLFKAIFGKKR